MRAEAELQSVAGFSDEACRTTDSVQEGSAPSETAGFTLLSDAATAACARVEAQEMLLEFGVGDALAGQQANLAGKFVREISTHGGGACSIHAAFGSARRIGDQVKHERPRSFLREVLEKPLAHVLHAVRPVMRHVATSVVTTLWTEFVTPYVLPGGRVRAAPNEESIFLRRLQRVENNGLW